MPLRKRLYARATSTLVLFALCAYGPHTLQATTLPAAPKPAFEVATVKPSGPEQRYINSFQTYPGARVICRGCTLLYLLREAYHLPQEQLIGGPSWMDETRFDITARPPADVAAQYTVIPNAKNDPPDIIRQMTLTLLEERFQLKARPVEKQGTVYALEVRGTPKISPSANPLEYPWAGGIDGGIPDETGVKGMNVSMVEFAFRLTQWLRQPVIDQTHLTGAYDFEVKLDPVDNADDMVTNAALTESLHRLGFTLTRTKGVIHTVVIDGAELPTPN